MGTGINDRQLADQTANFSFEQQRQAFDNAVELSPIDGLGLETGIRLSIHDHGIWGYAMMTAPNVYQTLVVLARFYRLAGSPMEVSLKVTSNEYRLVLSDREPPGKARQVFIDEFITATHRFLRTLTDRKFRFKALQLDCKKPSYAKRYTEILNCPVLFDKPASQLIISRAKGALPITTSDPETAHICKQRCDAILQRMQAAEHFVDRVRETLLRLPCNHRHADRVAAELAMSSRHLRRKLQDEKTSFQTVLDNVRFELSKDYLLQTRMPLEEIAPLLGFSELTNFRRAFKKWAGQTPSAYRLAQSKQMLTSN